MKATLLLPLALALSTSIFMVACSDKAANTGTEPKTEASKMTELVKTDVTVGNGAEAQTGQIVSVHYTGWLYDENAPDKHGVKFDSSVDRGEPFQFPLGAGRVIQGWDQGVAGMKVGGKRTLIIPAELGYGARGAGGVIPPNATLMFDVELLGVQ
ncbi:FKBP-type peptidyl-prolyl cis-trans isomerase [Thiothrix nivea]|uniref:Peptidyl-prolyl cis-trans isomerase n=1 Tax=Thiothrix nivea (strain ATCC 35100 / DSM 5205 / JP2) TaxID=870187 RepID=A0A656HDY5_THINJ|nr:FKBP-type peptidyl-prolyl cis-trans isomerase [Thiothrix nivea]EIJ35361.1 peptidylprolyl isomerase FKBP-type [Thiothrix nivea DSM 5205]